MRNVFSLKRTIQVIKYLRFLCKREAVCGFTREIPVPDNMGQQEINSSEALFEGQCTMDIIYICRPFFLRRSQLSSKVG